MFGEKKEGVDCDKQVRDLEHKHQLRISEIESEHKLALKEKEFELRHFKDDEMKKLSKELSDAQQSIAVLRKENEMLGKITNLNADIIDIKSLVNNLIEKLPTINLSSLTLNGNNKE
jgi:hypothetical protein